MLNMGVWDYITIGTVGLLSGTGGIFLAVKFFSNAILSIALKNIDLKNAKELEQLKINLLNKDYISKTRFDIEFQLYRELSGLFFELVKNVQIIIPNSISYQPEDVNERKAMHDSAVKSLNNVREILYKNAPFIPEERFNKYMEVMQECHGQIVIHELDIRARRSPLNKEGIIKTEHFVKTGEIVKAYNALNNDLRVYLSKLDVLD